jgi:hypothetical protein
MSITSDGIIKSILSVKCSKTHYLRKSLHPECLSIYDKESGFAPSLVRDTCLPVIVSSISLFSRYSLLLGWLVLAYVRAHRVQVLLYPSMG